MIVLKNSKELALMKQAGKITAEALWAGVRACKPGTTTWEINRVVHEGDPFLFGTVWLSGGGVH